MDKKEQIREMAEDAEHVSNLVVRMLAIGAKSATFFLSKKKVVRVTRPAYKYAKNKKYKEGFTPLRYGLELRVHIGRPNYLERAYIKKNADVQMHTTFKYPVKRKIKR